MTRPSLPSATLGVRAALLVLPLATAVTGCFPELAVDELKCKNSLQCPADYVCGPDEKCCKSRDGIRCDTTSTDAAAGSPNDSGEADALPGRVEVGKGDGPSAPGDGPGSDLARGVAADAQLDVPLVLDTPIGDGPGEDDSLGTGGAPGSGGTTGPDAGADAQMGGITGTGGVSANGGTIGPGGKTGTGGNGGGGSPLGTGGGLGGRMSTGGSGTGGAGTGGVVGTGGSLSCVGMALPTADPTVAGPFEVATDKDVGPLAGIANDPIYGEQKRFNVYRPKNLATSGYCHPILIWANGYKDNPEPNPPKCVLDSLANQWCGQYLPLMNHLASHGFVVIASLSAATAEGDPLPTIAGLDWMLQEAEDSSSPYYHHLDTANIGQLGHSYGGISTCMSASEPRYKALATICGTSALTGIHTPILFYCGGKNTTNCSGVRNSFLSITDQPAFFINELASDNGWWVYQGASGVSFSMAAAWFRVHLMGDTANRKYFYGANCTFCTDARVQAERNSLMTQ